MEQICLYSVTFRLWRRRNAVENGTEVYRQFAEDDEAYQKKQKLSQSSIVGFLDGRISLQ